MGVESAKIIDSNVNNKKGAWCKLNERKQELNKKLAQIEAKSIFENALKKAQLRKYNIEGITSLPLYDEVMKAQQESQQKNKPQN